MDRKNAGRILLVVVAAAAIAAFFLLDLDTYFSLSFAKERQADFRALYSSRPFLVAGTYFGVYVLVVALNLPGALVMSLAGGALFGLWMGILLISFASSLGATLACLAARYLLRNTVRKRFSDTLAKVDQGLEREGMFYLFSLRLIPVIPFFAINLVFGLTGMRPATFYWVSQLGMLPGTIVFVNAGKELGKIDSLQGILSPGLILSFALLGLFPLAMKKLLPVLRRKQDTPEP